MSLTILCAGGAAALWALCITLHTDQNGAAVLLMLILAAVVIGGGCALCWKAQKRFDQLERRITSLEKQVAELTLDEAKAHKTTADLKK